jgi:hypothetical protein
MIISSIVNNLKSNRLQSQRIYRASENKKKIEKTVINTLQVATRKHLIQMSLKW